MPGFSRRAAGESSSCSITSACASSIVYAARAAAVADRRGSTGCPSSVLGNTARATATSRFALAGVQRNSSATATEAVTQRRPNSPDRSSRAIEAKVW